ncbi:hypothetical protein ACFQH6_06640 [Halobacteriaceae archaeon GCM10025711]
MGSNDDSRNVSRRAVLRASGGAFGIGGLGSAWTSDDGRTTVTQRCPDGTLEPNVVQYARAGAASCADDHPATRDLQHRVRESLEARYPTVGSLLDQGYVPYFDFMTAEGETGWSHWLNPEFVADDAVMDPDRPEAVLVDHRWWRPIGVMFTATRNGDRIDSPSAVYGDEQTEHRCVPWHAHVGVPGRYAWWKFRLLSGERTDGETPRFPCRTPWVMHVWTYPHPESVYAHHAPPRGNRGGPPAEPAGFETDAVPGEDDLDWSVLPDAFLHHVARQRRGGQ